MNIDFNNIFEHAIPLDDFMLKWRFSNDELNSQHINQLMPLDKEASAFLYNYISNNNLHNDFPFKEEFFNVIDKTKILSDNEADIKKWLYHRGIAFDKLVFLSWDKTNAMIVPWKILIKYFNNFYYGSSDDLTVIDQSLNWALLFFHEDEIYFGTTKGFIPSSND
jgi:hypothetical protein